MKATGEDQLWIDYLLGRLPERAQVRLEEEYLADPAAQSRLLAVEDELVEAYLCRQISPAESRQFEARFLASPRGRRRLEVAKSLITLASVSSSGNLT